MSELQPNQGPPGLGDRVARALAGFWRQLAQDRTVRYVAALSLLFSLAINLRVYQLAFRGASITLLPAAYCFALSTLTVFAILLCTTLHRVAFLVLFPAVSLASAVAAYYMDVYNIYINENTLALAFETTVTEARDHISGTMLLYGLAGFLVAAAAAWLGRRWVPGRRRGLHLKLIGGVFALISVIPLPYYMGRSFQSSLPLSLFVSSYVYFRERAEVEDLLRHRKDLGKEPREYGDSGLTVVVVIGEATRPDHLHINGYERQTTPRLEELGAISFPRVEACETNTRFAVPCLMTRATRASLDVAYEETSFISVFRSLGFDTSWFSNQGLFWSANLVKQDRSFSAITAIASEAHHVDHLNPTGDVDTMNVFDEALLPDYDRALGAGAGPAGNHLVVLHTAGAHWNFSTHYPPEFERYTPVCRSNNPHACDRQAVLNSYDNAMLHTDHLLGEVIERLKDRKAILLYVSDHGESLGEGGQYGHVKGSEDPYQRQTAMLAWVSPRFAEAYPERVAAMTARRLEPLTQDNVFHSVLDCSGVRAPFVDRSLSICEPPPALASASGAAAGASSSLAGRRQ